jgi:hypothetical protein
MSNHDDDLTRTLTRELGDRAHEVDGSLLHLADVQGKARSIRRRRTAAAVAGVAAAVALIVPTVALASHSNGKPHNAPPASQGTSPTQTATDDGSQPAAGVLDVRDLPTGAAPAFDYVESGDLQFHDGGSGTVNTQYAPSLFAALDDGARVWQTISDQGDAYIEIQDADGTFHEPVRSANGLVVNDEHNAVGWVTTDGQVMVWSGRASEPRPLGDPVPGGHDIRIATIVSQDCTEFCEVYVNGPADGAQVWQPYVVTDQGTEPYRDGGLRMVKDMSRGLTIGLSTLDDTSSCSDLYGGGEFAGFDTCKVTLESFAPDASTVLGYLPYYDGIGSTSVSMWNLEGHKLFERSANPQHQAAVGSATWEDDTHVIAAVFQENTWSLVRIGTDGTMEYAVPPVHGSDFDNPFILPTGGVPSSAR